MDDDVVLEVHITTNNSFEWVDVIPDGCGSRLPMRTSWTWAPVASAQKF